MKIELLTGVCPNDGCPSKRTVEHEDLGDAFTQPAEKVLLNDKGQCVWCDTQVVPREELIAHEKLREVIA